MPAVEMPSPVMLCPRGSSQEGDPTCRGRHRPSLGRVVQLLDISQQFHEVRARDTLCSRRALCLNFSRFALPSPLQPSSSHQLARDCLAPVQWPLSMLVLPSPVTLCDTCPPFPEQLPMLLVCGFLPCPASSLMVEFTEALSWAPVSSLFGHLSGRSISLIQWMDFMHKKLH